MISRDQAREIAEREIIARGLGTGVKTVYRPDELDGRALRNIYYTGPALRQWWVAYAARPFIGLMSSNVVLIDRENGAVLYAGSANDEG